MENRVDPVGWLKFVRRSGPDGARWAWAYERHLDPVRLAQDSVAFMRRREFERGEALLEQARAGLEAVNGDAEISVRYILERWYYAALAYSFYAREAYDRADLLVLEAGRRIAPALERSRCLVPLAMDWCELQLQRARVARETRNWPLMWDHAHTAAAMRAGQIPLCTLSDGTEVGLQDVQRFYRSITVAAEEQENLAAVLDDRQWHLQSERLLRSLLRFPGLIVPCP